MKRSGLYLFTIAIIVIAAVWGISERRGYSNIVGTEDFMSNMVVAQLPEEMTRNLCQEMESVLSKAPIVLRVSPTNEMEYSFLSGKQSVSVLEVFKGRDVFVGQELSVNFPSWSVILTDQYDTVQCGFVNAMKRNRDYLVFLNDPFEALDGDVIYPFYGDTYVAPMFCYTDSSNRIIPMKEGDPTYVPFSLVKDNEFFVTTENALQEMMRVKRFMLDKYAIGNGK